MSAASAAAVYGAMDTVTATLLALVRADKAAPGVHFQIGTALPLPEEIFGAIYTAVYSLGAPATRDLQRIEATSRSPIFTQARRTAHAPLRLRPPTPHARRTPHEHCATRTHAHAARDTTLGTRVHACARAHTRRG